jgi:hypothetical protein
MIKFAFTTLYFKFNCSVADIKTETPIAISLIIIIIIINVLLFLFGLLLWREQFNSKTRSLH